MMENDEPSLVLMSFEEYEKLIKKVSNIQITGNIHQDIVNRAQETIERSIRQRGSSPQVPPTVPPQPLVQPLEPEQSEQLSPAPAALPNEPREQAERIFPQNQEFSPAKEDLYT